MHVRGATSAALHVLMCEYTVIQDNLVILEADFHLFFKHLKIYLTN